MPLHAQRQASAFSRTKSPKRRAGRPVKVDTVSPTSTAKPAAITRFKLPICSTIQSSMPASRIASFAASCGIATYACGVSEQRFLTPKARALVEHAQASFPTTANA